MKPQKKKDETRQTNSDFNLYLKRS